MDPISDPINADELTLDELAIRLAPSVADAAIFDGWNEEAVANAAEMEGVDPKVARLAYPNGAMDMIIAWITEVDQRMARDLPAEKLAEMKIRERIRTLVQYRLDAVAGQEEAVRRAVSTMAMPLNAPRAARRSWETADKMWRLAGDTATDYNHYTKRAILSGVYASTLARWSGDESEGKEDTKAFLDRRIDDVMQFEKLKAKFTRPGRERFSVSRFLGRLRYPAR